MATENDKAMETMDIWKKRVIVGYLLIALIFGVVALLILEFGIVEKAWTFEGAGHAAGIVEAAPTTPQQPPIFVIRLGGCGNDGNVGPEAMAEVPPETRFNAAMHELYGRIVRESGYTPTIFFRMIEQYGGVEAAHRLLKPDADFFNYGFEHLCRMKRGDLTVESLVLSLDYKDRIFTERELTTAGERLAAARQLFNNIGR